MNGAIGGKSVQSFILGRIGQDLKDHCRKKETKVSTSVAKTIESAWNLLPLQDVLVKLRRDDVALPTELEKALEHIMELESIKTVPVPRHKQLLIKLSNAMVRKSAGGGKSRKRMRSE